LAQSSIPSAMVGHAGDGNFHLVFMIDPDSRQEIAEASRINERMIARALAMEGTCTGEHGVGYGKIKFLLDEHGEAVEVMRAIKRALDPDDIMNPGKIVSM
jgi:D-lactate dehydrogenase (cytochrome)